MGETRPDSFDRLVEAARRAAGGAYAPYSGYRVGSALLCGGDGALFHGCNVENASYGLSLCAERAAAASAVAAGRRDFQAVAVYASGPELPTPCGACRQFLAEFNPDLVVIVSNGEETRHFPLSELLPHAFGCHHLPPSPRPRNG